MRCECDQQPVSMDSTDMVFTSHSMGPVGVGRSVDPALLDSSVSMRNSDNGASKINMRTRRTPGAACVDSPNRHASGVLYSPSHLETILQGQELLVNTNLSSSTSPRVTFSPGRTAVTDGPGDPILSPPVKSIPCCPCRGTESRLFTGSLEPKNDSHGGPSTQVRNGDNNNKYATRSSSHGNTTLNGQDSKPGVHWACDNGRLRNLPGPVVRVSSDEEMTLIGNNNGTSNQLKSDPSRCGTVGFPVMVSPDTIDPRRLPKSHGPASASLEFSNKPLQPHFLPPSSSPTPIPKSVATNRSSALKSPSWKIRKPLAKVRWLSQSVSNDSKRQEDSLLSCSAECHSLDGHLISSALEEVKGAMDILAGKSQAPPSGCGRTCPVRFKRASESERVLMISKSLPDTKDIAPPCSFGHFDEDHMYGALFRCSTCYDALPGSGKLIILDSRLGVIRAIRALLENGIQAAPIWHSALQKVVGLFSRDIALHLLASLCPEKQSSAEPSQQVLTNGVRSSVDCGPDKSSSLASGLAKWGKKQLLDVLRLFYQEPGEYPFELTESALIVSPQTVLRKVLCLLTHHHKHRGSATDHSHHSPQSSKQSDVNIRHLLEEHYDCCFEIDPPEIESKDDALTTDPSKSQYHHSSEPAVAADCAASSQSSNNQQAFSVDGNSSHGPSAACSMPSLSNPSHVIVVDPNSGNALGLLNTNRLLVYLRMRSEELPCSPQIISPVGCIPGLRWAERCTLNARNRTRNGSGSSLSTTSDLFQASDPVLLSTTTCSEAICRLIEWLPYLPCLPVVYMNEGAATQPTALLGFVSPGDILQLVLEDSPDVAITQPVSRIFNSRSNLGRWQRDWICYTHEPIITVLDRMVRLRAPCLALCDSPKRGSPVFGLPIGIVTARDLLHTVVTTRSTSQRRHPKLVHQSSSSSASVEAALGNSSKWSKSSSLCEYDDGISLSHEFGSDRSMDPSTTSQSARKLKTNSDSLLGLSNSLSQASSTSSASTYSACCSDGDEDEGTEGIQRPEGRRLSLTEDFQCSCSCHHDNSGNTKSREPVRTRSLKVKPTYGPKSNFSSPSSHSQQVHPNSVNDQIRHPHTAVAAASSPTEARGSRSTSRRLASKIPDWLTNAAARLPAVNKQPAARPYTVNESGDRIVSPGHGKKRDDDDGVFPMD